MGVEAKKNKLVAFLIKAALKERVGVLGSWGGGGGQSKLSHSFTPISCDRGTLGAGSRVK